MPHAERDLLLDLDNEPITAFAAIKIVLPVYYEVAADLQVGDLVGIAATEPAPTC